MTGIRKIWLEAMLKIADPVLMNLSKDQLHKSIPTAFHSDRKQFILLEAFGRTLNGMAPWLELEGLLGEEAQLQTKYRQLARVCLEIATNPLAEDYMNFGDEWGQPLVDTAFLAHAIVRAPKQLYYCLAENVQKQLADALKKSRCINPCPTNWLFFSAMVEAALCVMGQSDYDKSKIDTAMNLFEIWYKGDGIYGDGPDFHWDYYNSFVIQPMYVDVLEVVGRDEPYKDLLPKVKRRAARYAEILERMIAPDGTYPIMGRSVCYRFGCFQMLAQAALEHLLPSNLAAEQVREALTAVLQKLFSSDALFDEEGWLTPGVYGKQPELAEGYISIGSLYLFLAGFLPLGLSQQDSFWSGKSIPWTSCKIWAAQDIAADHAIEE